ncbi:MFS transporter [Massilia sp. Mn16-1_5]|uniref:MFS transporter n=1 Tax=Massilia sp. Mn16-1_5 TaxID=2079199 RepID=UPI001E312BE0|nr:MFS transporter [Massilia sp. Mn16-1_5]
MMKPEPALHAPGQGLDTAARRWASFAILLGTFVGNIGVSIANVALPNIAQDLHAQAAQAIWVVNAYQLAMVVAVLPLAALGEKFGYKRVFMAGLVVFTLASLLCALAPNLETLVAARVLQGLGGACVSTIVPALLRAVFPPRLVGAGIGYLALTVAVSAAIGPSIAAGILSAGSWRWLFGLNLPLALLAIALAARILPRSSPIGRSFDLGGTVLNAVTLTLFVIGASELGDADKRGTAALLLVLGCVSAVLLVRHQRDRAAPLLPLDLLRMPVLRLSTGTSIASYTAQTVALLALPFLLIAELKRSASATGLLMTPWPLVIVVVAPLSGKLADRFDSERIGAAGLALFTLGLTTLALLPAAPSDVDIVWRVTLCGIGFGLFQTPNNRLLLTSAPPERSGAAGGLMTMARMVGMTGGAALATVMLDLHGTRGAGTALDIAAGVAGLGLLVALFRMRRGGG